MSGFQESCWLSLSRAIPVAVYGLAISLSAAPPPAQRAQQPTAQQLRFFETSVRPVLVEHCQDCHGPEGEMPAGLRVDSWAALLRGGRSGPAIAPGEPRRSLLILAVEHDPSVKAMPPKAKLAASQIESLVRWVQMGAPWPQAAEEMRAPSRGQSVTALTEADRDFWAWQAPRGMPLPAVRMPGWPRGPLDTFLLAGLESQDLQPAPTASRRKLIRRATFDLHGLPPRSAAIQQFLEDASPDAWSRLVDRLLASPRYGERWGRRWLDVARYADSNGMDDNMAYADAWRYRDYVIDALNADRSYDRFILEQLAGDLLPRPDTQVGRETDPFAPVIATGFLMIGPKMLAEDDPVKQQMDIVDDQIDTVGRVFMGLTLGCARCHDHKFDPITIDDYYALAGIFKSSRVMLSYRVDSKWNSRAFGPLDLDRRLEHLEQELNRLDETLVLGNFIGREDEKKRVAAELDQVRKAYAQVPKAMASQDGEVEDLQVFLRGNHLIRGRLAARRFPRLLSADQDVSLPRNESGRRQFAAWLTQDQHPLTARVMVNRIWQGHFVHGLVRSVDNFGRLGQRPTNQPLLDWLALQFVESGWSIKQMHLRCMTSEAYRMSTRAGGNQLRIDPENHYLSRMNRRRMEAEVLRDSLLEVADRLDGRMGGAVLAGKTFRILSAETLKDPALYASLRRSVYLPVLRSGLYEMFRAFDFPDPAVVSGNRSETTVAPQALFMMNSQLMDEASAALEVLSRSRRSNSTERMEWLFGTVLGRLPRSAELADWRRFLSVYQDALAGEARAVERKTWRAVCRVLLASNEFLYID
ncbi:MAG: PSD1 and planctomycete cytochrome C domain-containing protein [Planctomycetota bacterium]|nr:PSD1 and planctomycete cytochrome C domain-containing protein [Planctomycetota bacterium]